MGYVDRCFCDYCGLTLAYTEAIRVKCVEVFGGAVVVAEKNHDDSATIMCRPCWKARISDGWGAKEVRP